jgi:hypothetical protein
LLINAEAVLPIDPSDDRSNVAAVDTLFGALAEMMPLPFGADRIAKLWATLAEACIRALAFAADDAHWRMYD